MYDDIKKKKSENRKKKKKKGDKEKNSPLNENESENAKKDIKKNGGDVTNIMEYESAKFNKNCDDYTNQQKCASHKGTPKAGVREGTNDDQNMYYIFEELIFNEDMKKKVRHYTWFYYFENLVLKLDNCVTQILNYSYYILNNMAIPSNSSAINKKRNILLVQSTLTVKLVNRRNRKKKFTSSFNNNAFKRIEQIVMHKEEISTNSKTDKNELKILNYLKNQNIKSMIYINDIFEPQFFSILFLVHTKEEKDIANFISKQSDITEYSPNKNVQKLDCNEYGILRGYDIILLRYSYEIIHFYKNSKATASYNNHICNQINEHGKITKKNNHKSQKKEENYHANEQAPRVPNNSNLNKDIIEKNKYHTMLTWRNYLNDSNELKQCVVLDALNICSGMDGYIDGENFNFDVMVNDAYSYLVKYKTKLSIFRLIYAVTSLLKSQMRPIIYIPHWWYHDIPLCEKNIIESGDFHLFIFKELEKDGFLKIGSKNKDSSVLTMDEKDTDLFVELAIEENAILCTNNNDIIKYYIDICENAKVSKFIAKGTFFMLANFL
ncbi:conserved Plasmodium protein, unknown function [Plasmodium knowlesi strain H]|uniref:Uncharacterized protein n=3 Tax=Plasmodium knowlesi TaxID=5850 RepID=A0A5K1UPH9_PLAKH|nr:conserved Plasmodium protein, unknown function [Plasmodium knowlesi strain H]OTN64991.1 Uncharacterized protein PKNOH_S120164200 [Plasmodium knowlesi]CAA9988498.1 conserved Plasmodium protein, unknown function [Plasmodium knowlesi strain H]SBO19699.1 conserved Plasmodium protein, unknown function [Plasmodium knowlesi strain H]SBO20505.1 conserved Plasmodium protein, unknown function [Plasmodium knowlesi strain H]VVS77972.1 conserved Plasmodium protein, unknown function [Plasmodium knowlesi |eukprot:XP_002259475.1 hypothetical protein, conserved in Plasmodium species [Plasmodium knowlesi strain H]